MLLAMVVASTSLVSAILSTVYYSQGDAGEHLREYETHKGVLGAHLKEFQATTDILREMRAEMKEQAKYQRVQGENLIRIGERLRVRHLHRPEDDDAGREVP